MKRSVARRYAHLLGWTLATGACASGGTAVPAGAPVVDPAPLAAEIAAASVPAGPRQTAFTWSLDEGGSTVRGRGVVRYHAPRRIRLDLFGPRNETYLSAALVGDEFRLPPTATGKVALPSPALLWAGLGVVKPPDGAALEGATTAGDATVLRYRLGDDAYLYTLRGEERRLTLVERHGPSGVLESVRIQSGPDAGPGAARYREHQALRELNLQFETTRDVESFPESVWRP